MPCWINSRRWLKKAKVEEYAPVPNYAWGFITDNGYQYYDFKGFSYYAWAVRSGDVAAVPEPGVMGLLGIGALAWAGTRARRRG